MKRMLAGLALVLGTAALSGCYYDPGYSYVRSNGYQGDAYYGEGPSVIYEPDYYGYGGYYGPGWGYGCCYSPGVSVGISGTWRGDSHHYRGRDWSRERHDYRDDRHDRREWRGRDDRSRDRGHDDRSGDHRSHGRGDWRGRDRD